MGDPGQHTTPGSAHRAHAVVAADAIVRSETVVDTDEPWGNTVLLADDNPLIRQGVQSLIELALDLNAVGVAAEPEDQRRADPADAADGQLTADEEILLRHVAEGTPIKVLARRPQRHPAQSTDGSTGWSPASAAGVLSTGSSAALDRLRVLQRAILEREPAAVIAMHEGQEALNRRWQAEGPQTFGLGIGVTTGTVAGVLLGSEKRMQYTVGGDTVDLAQRIQQWANAGETVPCGATVAALTGPAPICDVLEPALVKGRDTPVRAHRFSRTTSG